MRSDADRATGFPERSAAAQAAGDRVQPPGEMMDQPKLPPEGTLREGLRRASDWLRRHRPLARAFGSAMALLAAFFAARRGS
jgi:hypothetical protein